MTLTKLLALTGILMSVLLTTGTSEVHWLNSPQSGGWRLQNAQVLVEIPGAFKTGGTLLDPNSVQMTQDGSTLDTFVYYKKNDLALIFSIPNPVDEPTTASFHLTGSFIGSDERIDTTASTYITPHAMSGDLPTTRGAVIQIRRTDGEPIKGAFVFTQRRADLLGRTNAQGCVLLDSFNRNARFDDIIWAKGYFPVHPDFIAQRVYTLTFANPDFMHDIPVRIESSGGEPVSHAILLVDSCRYQVYEAEKPNTVRVRTDSPQDVFVIAAGYPTKKATVTPKDAELLVTLGRSDEPPQ